MVLLFFLCAVWSFSEANMPYHPCLFFVKVEVGRKKKAEDVSDVTLLLYEADLALMHANVLDAEKEAIKICPRN